MDDSKFDKLFTDKLGEEQAFDFREEDWTEVADRLEGKPKRRWGWLWIAAGLFMAVSFAANIWQARSLKKVQQEISVLQEQISSKINGSEKGINKVESNTSKLIEATQNKETIIVKRDTVYQTIYKTIVQEKEVPVYIYPTENTNPKGNQYLVPETDQETTIPSNTYSTKENTPSKTFWSSLNSLSLTPLLPLNSIDRMLQFSFLENPDEVTENTNSIIKSAFKKQWLLGPSVAYTLVPNTNTIQQNNNHLGIDANVQLSKRWTLESNYSYNRIKNIYTLPENVDTNSIILYGTNQKVNSPIDPDSYALSEIRNIKNNQSYLQISLGAKHNFSKHFYVGAHVLGYYFLKRQVSINAQYNRRSRSDNNGLLDSYPLEYTPSGTYIEEFDIHNQSDQDETFFEPIEQVGQNPQSANTTVSKRPGLIIDRLELTAGKEFIIKNKFRMPVELFYQRNLNASQFSLPPLVGLRASFLFKL